MANGSLKGMQQYRISCVGVSPLLLNPMNDEILDDLVYGAARRKNPERDISINDMAAKKVCKGPNGEFGVPANYLFAAMVEAGRKVVYDKKAKFSTLESSVVPSLLAIVPDLVDAKGDGFLPFLDQEITWIADRRRGVNATTKGATAIIRPKFPQWAFDVTIEVDESQVEITKIKELVTAAGRFAGLGDFRPAKRGPFGRFVVSKFEVMESAIELQKAA